ncbi:hypothetical protein BDZ89DRAFT_1059027 [Hymenopellis radicata]|nr:hypothetical protein BDZ89DRAFT_1059027 [Hymenopellis radicata]
MFFSPELLARRDNGFGLLWLAATLGSKSAFKKLPRRSVMTADIAQLCDLIAEPAEPLALRLSSNLMVGVARSLVKQEILFTDVTNCVASLKKVVLELQSAAKGGGDLQMPQPTIRASAVTLNVDPTAYDFDAFVADWDAFLNINDKTRPEENDEDPDDVDARSKKTRPDKAKEPNAVVENMRAAESCTLKENYEHLLSNSFDLSFTGAVPHGTQDPSSSQAEGFLDDPFFDGLDLGGELGDELARELGEGWGVPNDPPPPAEEMAFNDDPMNMDVDFNFGDIQPPAPPSNSVPPTPLKRKSPDPDKENDVLLSPMHIVSREATPLPTFTQELLSQDNMEPEQPGPLADLTMAQNLPKTTRNKRPAKKTRLLLDARTELTDEELKAARAQYLRGQKFLKEETEMKRNEKDNGRLIEEIIWGVPSCIQAPILVDFWQENFKVQVEARTERSISTSQANNQPPVKKRKVRDEQEVQEVEIVKVNADPFIDHDRDYNMDAGMDMEMGMGMQDDPFMDAPVDYDAGRQRSSEEPGQGRQFSRQSSITRAQFGLDVEEPGSQSQSQKSSLFPWDNAGFLSSSSGVGLPEGGSDRVNVERADVRIRGSSVSRTREDSLVPSQSGSGVAMSPGFDKGLQMGEDYRFEVEAGEDRSQIESQKSDMNLITLERNSFNFLEYAKMQMQTLSDVSEGLSFDAIVPKLTSTRHVASAAFYHCLVLATKDLLRLKQPEPYGPITLVLAA